MSIPRDTIDEILASVNIVDLVSEHVRLRKTGRNFVGLCPFHTEKTPSFTVSAEKSLFKCFGCGKGGNIFTFLMEHQKISFVEAVRQVAQTCGIAIPEESPKERARDEGRERLFKATGFASEFYRTILHSREGDHARRYLEKRHWTEETWNAFSIGYAPREWEFLLVQGRSAGVNQELLLAAGLLVQRDDGRVYDRFRNRIIFPIHSSFGKIMGFGARSLDPGEEPKYLNSPETPIYNKGMVLYGLYQASRAIRERDMVMIVEGYADVLSLHQAGIRIAVATSGTALTQAQIRLLSRYTKNFFFIYDADSAGANAMLRGIEVIVEEGFDVRVVSLPKGEDPDSFIITKGADAFNATIDSARSFVDYVIELARSRGEFETPEQKSGVLQRVVGLLALMEDEIRRDYYIKLISEKYDVYETVLFRELQKQKKKKMRRADARAAAPGRTVEKADDVKVSDPRPEMPSREREFLAQLLQAPLEEIMNILQYTRAEDFIDPRVRTIVAALQEQRELHGRIQLSRLGSELEDQELQRLVAGLSIPRYSISDRWKEVQIVDNPDTDRILLDTYKRIIAARIETQILSVQKKMKERDGTTDMNALLKRYQELVRDQQKCGILESFQELAGLRESIFGE